MIDILNTEVINESNGFNYEKCQISLIGSNLEIEDIGLKIEVLKFEDENFYCVDLSTRISNKKITEFLNSTFLSFLSKDGKSQNFRLRLPFINTNCDLFDSLTTTFYINKISTKAFIRIQIAQDFEIQSTNWGKYSPFYLYEELIKLGKKESYKNFKILQGEDDTEELVRLEFDSSSEQNLNEALKNCIKLLPKIEKDLQFAINTNVWLEEFHTDEPKFSKNLILPLLRKMKYDNVIYNHGKKEYGRDFLFSETNRFGEITYYGMQIKAGDISGKVNSEIDMLIGQLNDAFSMPFYLLGEKKEKYISTFIIAISGKYMENAREKIIHKIPNYFMGNVHFWDKSKILELIEKNWNK